MTIIARFDFPKQRATRKYGFIILEQYKDSYMREIVYSVNRIYSDGGMDSGSYNLTLEQAWKEYGERINKVLVNYGPNTWEPIKH